MNIKKKKKKDKEFISFLKVRVAMAHNFYGDLLKSFFKPCSKKFRINIWEPIPIQRYEKQLCTALVQEHRHYWYYLPPHSVYEKLSQLCG